jgi:hypothetical protein
MSFVVLIQLVEVGEGEKMNQIEDGCELSYQFAFSCSPTSTDFVYTTKFVLQANLRRTICKHRIEKRASSNLVMVIGSACLLVFQLDA